MPELNHRSAAHDVCYTYNLRDSFRVNYNFGALADVYAVMNHMALLFLSPATPTLSHLM
ncbi:hypothetical protein GQ43DRAFT_439441 [Delitschia confertaspora ATCC 74209]|uniref:Uncharacterized protein n=1 Tax=Delitschia confertaspora ATCC 74209 TaxID=1513339 RepID=A0A9P4MR96_9PLEO|nr:hypothetical protein GQ43DRAFT_439441 [Delitschia confertaspora ATCC 74209]